MSYVAFFRDPARPGRLQARKISRGFACKPEELRREIAIACGLARKNRTNPEKLLIDYHIYNDETADMVVDAHYAGQRKAVLNHAGKVVFA